jgi:hypothetical protein
VRLALVASGCRLVMPRNTRGGKRVRKPNAQTAPLSPNGNGQHASNGHAYGSEQADERVVDECFWSSRPELERIRDYALSKRTSPWAVLGVALVRVVAAVPPTVVLPDIVGDFGSLNLFVGLVARPGGGKSSAMRAGANAVRGPLVDDVRTHTLGSGQGIPHAYMRRDPKGNLVQHTTSAVFNVEEVDLLKGSTQQSGSTVLAELRRLYFGEPLGQLWADEKKHVPVEAHRYRAGLVLGIQPERADVILDDVAGGTPQRFLWLPATYRDQPDEPPAAPEPWLWRAPVWDDGREVVEVCSLARRQIDAAALATSRGKGDPLDSHRLFCREKLAAALGILNGRLEVNEQDWQLAGHLMRISDRTREDVKRTLAKAGRERNRARGRQEAEREVIKLDAVDERNELARQATSQRVLKLLGENESLRRSDLRDKFSGPKRAVLDDVIQLLVQSGQITDETIEYNGQTGHRYRLTAR